MQEKVVQENKMGIMPISKLIITMSLPIMASMLVQALYNIVDSIFVAKISENALTAVSMAFPIQNLMIAVGTGTGVGINALLARNLGAKNYKKVNHIANHAVFLAVLSYLLFLLIGFFGLHVLPGVFPFRLHAAAYRSLLLHWYFLLYRIFCH